jgi:5'-3' exonuclease
MGIRGFVGYLRNKLSHVKRPVAWTAGQTWAIDCSCLLYRARAAGLSPMTVVASLLVRMRRMNVTPIVVFDGRPPVAKAEVTEQRRADRNAAQQEIDQLRTQLEQTQNDHERAVIENRLLELQRKAPPVTRSDKDELKQFLYAAGVLAVTPNGEADDVLAYLSRTGQVHAVVSTDMDMMARGVSCLIVPESDDTMILTQYYLADVLSGLHVTYEQFVLACMMMGTDYTPKTWRTVPPGLAISMVRGGIQWNPMQHGEEICRAMWAGADLLKGVGVEWTALMGEKQYEKWAAGAPVKEPGNLRKWGDQNGWPFDWVQSLSML